jgi:hypothetical protein
MNPAYACPTMVAGSLDTISLIGPVRLAIGLSGTR